MADVYLVGAGPGDPGLLTVKARDLIRNAEVLIYDYLANPEFLKLANKDAEIYYVGKKGGDHTLPQDKINDLIVKVAAEGKRVVRLKGGDPYVFGRGGEEAEEIAAAGLSFEVVPGVTAGVAASAYAGIPVTHRKFTSSVCFITGHEDPTKEASAHDWEAYVRAGSTLVFYMGVKNLPMIANSLMKAGMAPDTPAAVIRWGTTCRQRSLVSDISKIAAEVEKLGIKPPAIIVVGGVCSLASRLDWFEDRPLMGLGVAVTRAREQASGLVETLSAMGACVYEFPTIEVHPLDNDAEVEGEIVRLSTYDWAVFTSVNGVKHFFAALDAFGLDSRALGAMEVGAIGPATAQALAERGIRPDFVPDKYVAEHVVEGLLAKGAGGKRVLIPRALEAREVLPAELAKAGCRVKVLPVYETRLAGQDPAEIVEAVTRGDIRYLTFTSSSTVHNFFAKVPADAIRPLAANLVFACIGPVTAETLGEYGFAPGIMPEDYTVPALARALAEHAEAHANNQQD